MCGGVSICIWCGCFGCAVVCTTLKNDVWHSYQSLSVDMNAPTDSRIRVHSLVQHPAVLGSSYLSPLSLRKLVTENSRHRKFTEQTTTLTSQSRRGLCLLLAFPTEFQSNDGWVSSLEIIGTRSTPRCLFFVLFFFIPLFFLLLSCN